MVYRTLKDSIHFTPSYILIFSRIVSYRSMRQNVCHIHFRTMCPSCIPVVFRSFHSNVFLDFDFMFSFVLCLIFFSIIVFLFLLFLPFFSFLSYFVHIQLIKSISTPSRVVTKGFLRQENGRNDYIYLAQS